MRATLIYNERSGSAASEDDVLADLSDIGWKVDRCLSKKQLDDCLCHGAEVVVVAGGDGTIAKVAKRLAGTEVPMAIVPMGTANNVARSLGIGVDPALAVLGLSHPVERAVDLGVVQTKRARDLLFKEYFLEGFGLGVFAHVVAEKATKKDKKLRKAVHLIANELDDYAPRHFELEVDGRDFSGPYVLLAVMNARSLGPALGVAPDARCDDGELDVVLVRPEAKGALVSHLRRAAVEGDIALPTFETARATQVRVVADGRWAHIDDVARQLEGEVNVEVAKGAVKVLAPWAPHTAR
jgi:diacylglycerol kinase family enzyme